MKKTKWILILTVALFVSACSKDHNQKSPIPLENIEEYLSSRSSSMVVDENGNPVSNAQVLIGEKGNPPYHSLVTDENGMFKVPTSWNQELPVTIFKDGFITATYLKQTRTSNVFEIRPKKSQLRYEVKGSITGFGNFPNDGFIDFALTVASLEPHNALKFDISKLISEENDTINVMGQSLDIPTNVFLPKQKENYGFIPVTVEKAFYRLFFDLPATYRVQANRGKFDFKKVAEKLKGGKSFFEVVNDFEFLSVGTTTVNVNQHNVSLNMDSNQFKLAPKADFTTPMPASGMLFGVTLLEQDNKLLPADVKLREARAQKLSFPVGAEKGQVLLIHADKVQVSKDVAKLSNSMSTALIDMNNINSGYLLERISAPEVTNNGLKMTKPTLKGHMRGYATYAALSDVTVSDYRRFSLERTDITWEIYSPGWVDSIDLPDISNVRANQKWEVVFFGIEGKENKIFNGPKSLNQATHAVHNAVNF